MHQAIVAWGFSLIQGIDRLTAKLGQLESLGGNVKLDCYCSVYVFSLYIPCAYLTDIRLVHLIHLKPLLDEKMIALSVPP